MLTNNFRSLEYHYNTEYSCEESGCNEEGICRCSRIIDECISHVNMIDLSDEIYSEFIGLDKSGIRESKISTILYGGKEVDLYCINRILSINKAYLPENWSVGVEGGYYGDEIGDISLDYAIFNKVFKQCEELFSLSNLSDKLEFVLSLEYDKILDSLKGKEYELIEISKADISFNKLNPNHLKLVNKKNLSHYDSNQYNLPRGIVRKSGNLYKIIDGFHRIIGFDKSTKFKVFCVK